MKGVMTTRPSELLSALERAGYDARGLTPIGVRPPLFDYVAQLWQRRHFIWLDGSKRALTSNAGTFLGNAWLILRPLIDAAFYFVIFGMVLKVTRGVDNFAAFIVIGILMFRSTSAAIGGGANLMKNHKSMIRAFNFPRASIPIASVLQSAITGVWTMGVMCVAIIVLPSHEIPGLAWLLIAPIFFLQVLLNLGLTFITARIGFHVPDMANLLSVVSRFLMYGSGVMFPLERFISDEFWRGIVSTNPLYQIIGMSRTVLMENAIPSVDSWLIVVAWVLVLTVGGFVFFWRGESSYGREFR